jgi:myo-inositol-1(or 4)-monophosphatase
MLAQSVRRGGSAALDLAYVAVGRLEGFWAEGLCPWDVAAGFLLVEEAGGRVTQYDGLPFISYRPTICASNELLHKDMLRVLRMQ